MNINIIIIRKIFLKIRFILLPNIDKKPVYLKNQVRKESKNEIPNIIYQTWVSRYLPNKLAKEVKKFRSLNNDFSFILFNDNERDDYMRKYWIDNPIYEIYINSVFQASKSDIFRYCIIYDKGGFYFDIKSGCKIPLSKLKISNGALISHENTISSYPLNLKTMHLSKFPFNILKNWAFGFKKNHPFLKKIINEIIKYAPYYKNYIFTNPKNAILSFTGPGMMTKVYRDYFINEDLKIDPQGIDFMGNGIYELEGSNLRFETSKSYAIAQNSKILN